MVERDLAADRELTADDLLATALTFHQRPRTPLGGEQLGDELIALRRACDLLELEFSELAARFATTNQYEEDGTTSPIDWIRHNCRMTGNAAADRVVVGEQRCRLPESCESLARGDIGFAHLALMAHTADALMRPSGKCAFDEATLLEKAELSSAGRFRHICHHARHAADAEAFAEDEKFQAERRYLKLTPGAEGCLFIEGALDPEGGALVRTCLEPLAKRSRVGDDRDRPRRLADALVEMANHCLDAGQLPQTGSQRPHLNVTTTLETLLGQPGAPAAELEFSLPISAQAVKRLACDCSVTRLLLGSESAVIDVGRARRVASGPAQKALRKRDGGCVFAGCERPASWTSAHHLVSWIDGGPTDLSNQTLLCYRHHWMVHNAGWQLVRTHHGRLITVPPSPDWTDKDPRLRRLPAPRNGPIA